MLTALYRYRANDEPPKKKPGFFSWLRKDLTEDVIKAEPTAEEVEAAKRAQEARGDANLFDTVGRAIESQQRDEISKTVGAEVPGDISTEEARRLIKKALKPAPTEVCVFFADSFARMIPSQLTLVL